MVKGGKKKSLRYAIRRNRFFLPNEINGKLKGFFFPPFFLHHVVQYLSLVSQISLSSIANKYCINFYDRYLHIFLSFEIFLWIFYIWRNRFDKMSLKRFLDNISISCQMTNKAIIKHLKNVSQWTIFSTFTWLLRVIVDKALNEKSRKGSAIYSSGTLLAGM